MRIVAFISEAPAVREILTYLGEPTSPPRMAPARGPPLWKRADAGPTECDPQVQPAPDYEFDSRASPGRCQGKASRRRRRFRPVMEQLVPGVSRTANAGRSADPRQ
jgi:hypothetical protein